MVFPSAPIAIIFCYLITNLSTNAQDIEGADLDSLIDSVFKKPDEKQNPSTSGPITSAPVTSGINLEPHGGGGDGGNSAGQDCVCVAYYLCNNGTVNTNGEGVIDIRINDGPCGNQYIEVCCKKDSTVEQPITPPPTRAPTGCGYRNVNGAGFRITGAKDGEAQFAEFPWMVAILREESIEGNPVKLNVYQCGGALIHPRAVVTAAHCVAGKNKSFKVRAGEWDTQHEKEPYPFQDREVQAIEIHPNFYAGALFNDIAVLILNEPVNNAENIGFVCLPPQNHAITSGRGFATGWGKDQFGKKGKYQVILKKIDLPIVSSATCQDKLRTTRLGRFFQLHESFICAGGEPEKDTCKGDGGSPLVFPVSPGSERYFQGGIVAWGIGCGENGTPGVYVNVAKFRNWVDEKVRNYGLDPAIYQY